MDGYHCRFVSCFCLFKLLSGEYIYICIYVYIYIYIYIDNSRMNETVTFRSHLPFNFNRFPPRDLTSPAQVGHLSTCLTYKVKT